MDKDSGEQVFGTYQGSISLKGLWCILPSELSEIRACLRSGLGLIVYVDVPPPFQGVRPLTLGQGVQAERWQKIELKSKHALEHMPFIKNIYQNICECECLLVLKWRCLIGFSGFRLERKYFSGCVLSRRLSPIIQKCLTINHIPSFSGLSQKLINSHFITSCHLWDITTYPTWADGNILGAEQVVYRLD